MDDSAELTCYVSNLHSSTSADLIEELFVQAGPVKKVVWKGDEEFRYALIVFKDEESVMFAVEILDNIPLFGKPISVKPKNDTQQYEKYKEWKKKKEREEAAKQQERHRVQRPTNPYHSPATTQWKTPRGARSHPYAPPQNSRWNFGKNDHNGRGSNQDNDSRNYQSPNYSNQSSRGFNQSSRSYHRESNIGMREPRANHDTSSNMRTPNSAPKWKRPNIFNKPSQAGDRKHFYE